MKHILFFIESFSGGGAEKVLITLLNHLDYTRYEVTLLAVNDIGVYRDKIDRTKIRVASLCGDGSSLWNRIKYKFIYHILPVRIICQWFIPQNVAVAVAFVEGFCTKVLSYHPKRKIAWVHIDLKSFPWPLEKGIYASLEEEKECYRKFDEVVCVSQSVESAMRSHYELTNTCTIYNPIDAQDIRHRAHASAKGALPKEVFNIMSIGRLEKQKGYDLLIPIIANLKKSGKDIHLYLVGEGSERQPLEKLIERHNLQDAVTLTGFLENPYPLLRQMDLFVCSSRSEGFSLVIAEALIVGIPVVSTYCSGPNELLQEGKYGILCHDYEALEKMMGQCVDDRRLLQSLKQKAMEGGKQFDMNRIIQQVERVL